MNKSITPLRQKDASLLTRLGNWLSLRRVARIMTKAGAGKVLDLGCGYDAQLLTAFSHIFQHGWGLDAAINPAVKEAANLSFLVGDVALTLPMLDGETFDLITAINFLEHIADPLPIVKRARLILAPGGRLFILAPSWRGKIFLETCIFKWGLGGENGRASLDEHQMYYTKRDLWLLLIRGGFLPSEITLGSAKGGLSVTALARKP